MKCPCGKHAACVPGCSLMDYPGYTVDWVEDDGFRTAYPEMPYSPPLPDVTRGLPISEAQAAYAARALHRVETEKFTPLKTPFMAYISDPANVPDPAPVASLVDEIDDWYAANDPLMAGAGDGNSPPWTEKTLLDDILEQRGSRYGRFADNAGIAQMIKDAVRSGLAYGQWADDQKEALDQIAAKLSRAATGDPDYVDNWDDIAGYAKLVAERLREG